MACHAPLPIRKSGIFGKIGEGPEKGSVTIFRRLINKKKTIMVWHPFSNFYFKTFLRNPEMDKIFVQK